MTIDIPAPLTIEAVENLFGPEPVKNALAEPNPADIDQELLDQIQASDERGDDYLYEWASGQSWPVFCAIVRVLSGQHRRAKLTIV